MGFFGSLELLCCVFVLTKASQAMSCQSPFRIEGFPHQCRLPQFNLFCKQNRTMIHFPAYGDLAVKSIACDTRRLNLLDPRNCVHEVFLNLNLSLTPFSYYYFLHHYRYINCSSKIEGSFQQVPCLSGSNHHAYVVEPSFQVPVSCNSVRTVAIPFSYSPYLSDSSFGLALTWKSIRLDGQAPALGCKLGILFETGHPKIYLRALYAVTGMVAFAFIVGKLLYASLPENLDKFDEEKVKKTWGPEEIDKLLGEC